MASTRSDRNVELARGRGVRDEGRDNGRPDFEIEIENEHGISFQNYVFWCKADIFAHFCMVVICMAALLGPSAGGEARCGGGENGNNTENYLIGHAVFEAIYIGYYSVQIAMISYGYVEIDLGRPSCACICSWLHNGFLLVFSYTSVIWAILGFCMMITADCFGPTMAAQAVVVVLIWALYFVYFVALKCFRDGAFH